MQRSLIGIFCNCVHDACISFFAAAGPMKATRSNKQQQQLQKLFPPASSSVPPTIPPSKKKKKKQLLRHCRCSPSSSSCSCCCCCCCVLSNNTISFAFFVCQGNINNKQTLRKVVLKFSQRVYRNASTLSFSSHIILLGIHVVFLYINGILFYFCNL